jgi:hypothetical protein
MPPNIHVNAPCSRSKGISLVDLVVLVTLLGLLSAFALPRFVHRYPTKPTSKPAAVSREWALDVESGSPSYYSAGYSRYVKGV